MILRRGPPDVPRRNVPRRRRHVPRRRIVMVTVERLSLRSPGQEDEREGKCAEEFHACRVAARLEESRAMPRMRISPAAAPRRGVEPSGRALTFPISPRMSETRRAPPHPIAKFPGGAFGARSVAESSAAHPPDQLMERAVRAGNAPLRTTPVTPTRHSCT